MDRYWLLTTTTYGTWLPGDSRQRTGGQTYTINSFGLRLIETLARL